MKMISELSCGPETETLNYDDALGAFLHLGADEGVAFTVSRDEQSTTKFRFSRDQEAGRLACLALSSADRLLFVSGKSVPIQARDTATGAKKYSFGDDEGYSSLFATGSCLLAKRWINDQVDIYDLMGRYESALSVSSVEKWHHHPEGTLLTCIEQGDAQTAFVFLERNSLRPFPRAYDPLQIVSGFGFRPQGDIMLSLEHAYTKGYLCGYDFPGMSERFTHSMSMAQDASGEYFRLSDSVAFAPDGGIAYVPTPLGTVITVDVVTGAVQSEQQCHDKAIVSVAMDDRNRILGTADVSGICRFWAIDDSRACASPIAGLARSFVELQGPAGDGGGRHRKYVYLR